MGLDFYTIGVEVEEVVVWDKRKVMVSREISHSRTKFSVSELSIVFCCLGKLYQSKELKAEDRWMEVTPEEYAKFRGVTMSTAIEMLDEGRKSLWGKHIQVVDPQTGKLQRARIIDKMDEEITSTFRFRFSEDFIPLICELKRYITCELSSLGLITRYSSYKLYFVIKELLLYKKKFEIKIPLEELYELLGITGKYKDFREFNRVVLKPSLKELKEKLNMDIDVEYVKIGKKIIGVRFIG
jgi:plasmid replication initiation protein